MSAIFLSYAREDCDTAERLAKVLIAKGHDVFWDREIKPGEAWADVLEREIKSAQCVLVLWSKHSTISRWVKAEASEALERGILLPAMIDRDGQIPFQFKAVQTVDLTEWDDDSEDPSLQNLLEGISHLLGRPIETPAGNSRRQWRRIATRSAVALAIAATLAGIFYGIGKQKDWFASTVAYHTYLNSAEGLDIGDPVLLNGKSVGRIAAIELMPPEVFGVFLGFEVRDPYWEFIWSNSRAKVQWHPSNQKRFLHIVGGASTTNRLYASYEVDKASGAKRFWDERANSYVSVGETGAKQWGFYLPAEETASLSELSERPPQSEIPPTRSLAETDTTRVEPTSDQNTKKGEVHQATNKTVSAETLALASGIRSDVQTRNYERAWKTLKSISPEERALDPIRELEIEAAQRWIQNASGDFKKIVDEVAPTLLRASGSTNRVIAANAKAHLGFANFLQWREGALRLKIDELYRQALELDPANVYAHTFWAHWLMRTQKSRSEAFGHIEAALATRQERPFVRRYQLLMLKNASDLEVEILKVLNAMRRNNEPLEDEQHNSLEATLYYPNEKARVELGAEIISRSDHLATYIWLTKDLPELLRRTYVLALLTERAGDRKGALELYTRIKEDSSFKSFTRQAEVESGIRRCRQGRG